jgi:N-ethylmaleimide reductase
MRLLEAIALSAMTLNNRMVLAIAGQEDTTTPGPAADDHDAATHADWARAGLVITQPLDIDPASHAGLAGARQLRAWRQVVERVHGAGGRIVARLAHGGGAAGAAPDDLTTDSIAALVGAFAAGAALARSAGFDGVELDAGEGGLIDRFLRPGSNHREDDYGGSVGRRARFLLEVGEAVAAVLAGGTVGVRLSAWEKGAASLDDDPLATFSHAAAALDQLGIAYLHIVEPRRSRRLVLEQSRLHFGGVVIASDDRAAEDAEALLAGGLADCVAFGRLPPEPVASLAGADDAGAGRFLS